MSESAASGELLPNCYNLSGLDVYGGGRGFGVLRRLDPFVARSRNLEPKFVVEFAIPTHLFPVEKDRWGGEKGVPVKRAKANGAAELGVLIAKPKVHCGHDPFDGGRW